MTEDLPPASAEQSAIVDAVIRGGHHVRVEAVAGSGKTTTILHIARACKLPLLVLTYNAKLKSETRARCDRLKIKNLDVHTYHSAALNLYHDKACARDEGIAALLRRPRRVQGSARSFAIIVIDEAQDMTHLYFALARWLIRDVCVPDVRIVVFGDARQSVYGFKGADARFLTLAHRLELGSPNHEWRHLTLLTSYRLAPRIAQFVNAQLLEGVELLRSHPDISETQGNVRYLRCNTFGEMPSRQVLQWLRSGMSESDIFVLAPSIRVCTKQSPVRMLENRLVRAGVRCYAASSDDERLDEDVTRGKIVFATFHQVKGLERKAVLVFNFDASYHTYYERDACALGCPNPIYVAATRAKQHLTLLHDGKQAPLRTVRMNRLSMDSDFVMDGSVGRKEAPSKRDKDDMSMSMSRTSDVSVTDLLRHQKQDVLHAAMRCIGLDGESIGDQSTADVCNTLLKVKVCTGGDSWENVAAITGTAMPSMFEYQSTGGCTLLARASKSSSVGLPQEDEHKIHQLKGKDLLLADFLYIANVHITLTGGFTHKLKQIEAYDWVRQEDVTAMLDVMREHVTGGIGSVLYEHPASLLLELGSATNKKRRANLSCAIDCLDKSTKTAFEIKCVSSLSSEHVLQAALNALLIERGTGTTKGYRHVLLNLCDGQMREICSSGFGIDRMNGIHRAAMLLLEAKFAQEDAVDDLTFLRSLSSVGVQQTTTSHSAPASPSPSYGFVCDDP